MSRIDKLFERAIQLEKSGQHENARSLLRAILQEQPDNKPAWNQYIETFPYIDQRIQAIEEYLQVFPGDSQAQKQLTELLKKGNTFWRQQATQIRQQYTNEIKNSQSASKRKILFLAFIGLCLLSIIYGTNARARQNLNLLSQEMFHLRNDYTNLQIDQKNLLNLYMSLKSDNDTLTQKFNQLVSQHNLLVRDHDLLLNEYNSVVSKHNQLVNSFNTLVGEHDQLVKEHGILTYEHSELERIALKPPYIFVHDREIEMTFYDTHGALIYWTTPFENLENYIERGYQLRDAMINEHKYVYTVYTDEGIALGTWDFSLFIDSSSFETVMTALYQNSATSDDFIYQVWNIIGQLSNYTYEEDEIPRFPSETMLAGGGDCEDLSILFASLIKAAPTNWYVDLVYVDSDNILDPQTHNHVIVYIDTGKKTYLVETTSDTNMQPYTFGVRGWLGKSLYSSDKKDRYPVTLQ